MIAIKLEHVPADDPRDPEAAHWARFRFQNMLEDVYRKLHDICLVDLEELDRAVDHFVVREIRRSDIGTVTTRLKRVLRHNRMLHEVRLVRVDRDAPGGG
jgi:hypothetical protein